MPYIPKKDRPRLDHLIQSLCAKTLGLAVNQKDTVWQYLKYIGLKLGKDAALDAVLRHTGKRNMRYWLIAILDGLYMNIARELRRRTGAPEASMLLCPDFKSFLRGISAPDNTAKLDKEINALVSEVSSIARGYNYDGAFVGLCNYILSALGALLILETYEKEFSKTWISLLVFFWEEVANEFYKSEGVPYEDEQITREDNGDCPIFATINAKTAFRK